VAWRSDGQALVSGSWDDTIILWDVKFEPWQERACRIANRNLDEEEWDEFIGPDLTYDTLCAEF
jgi:WD40 repeat protein